MDLRILTPSTADNPLRSLKFYAAVHEAPPAAKWFKLENVAGPVFSGLPHWFAHLMYCF